MSDEVKAIVTAAVEDFAPKEDKKAAAPAPAAGEEQEEVQAAPEPKADPKLSGKFAALARKERAIVQRQQEVQAKEAALTARLKALEESEAAWKADPIKAAEAKGLTYSEWTQRVLNGDEPTPMSVAEKAVAEVERLRQEREEEREAAKKAELERAQAAQEKVIEEFKEGVRSFVKSNSDEFELVNLHEAHGLVIATVEQYFEQTKKILDTKEACEMVEKFLEEQVIKSTETKKFKAKASSQPAEKSKGEPKSTSEKVSQQKTLTNNMTASTSGFLPAKTEQDRIKRAMAALERAKG